MMKMNWRFHITGGYIDIQAETKEIAIARFNRLQNCAIGILEPGLFICIGFSETAKLMDGVNVNPELVY